MRYLGSLFFYISSRLCNAKSNYELRGNKLLSYSLIKRNEIKVISHRSRIRPRHWFTILWSFIILKDLKNILVLVFSSIDTLIHGGMILNHYHMDYFHALSSAMSAMLAWYYFAKNISIILLLRQVKVRLYTTLTLIE